MELPTHTIEIDRDMSGLSPEEFTLARRNGIGASDVSTILGCNPYKTSPQLLKNKISTEITDEERELANNINIRKGQDLEPLILDKAGKILSKKVHKPTTQYRFKDFPFIKVNFDGVIAVDAIPVEAKVVTSRGNKNYDRSRCIADEKDGMYTIKEMPRTPHYSAQVVESGIPIYYHTQVQLQMYALGAKYGYLAALHESEWVVRLYRVDLNLGLISDFLIKAQAFWERVDKLKGS